MINAIYWENLGFSKHYAIHIAKGIRAMLRHLDLTERDLAGLVQLVKFRNSTKPEMPIDQFVLFLTLLSELNFLSEKSYKGWKKFYKDDETIKNRIEVIGEVLAEKDKAVDSEDPIEWMMTEFLAHYYKEKNQNSITIGVDAKLFSEFMEMANNDEGKAFGRQLAEKTNALLKDWHKRVKDRVFREKFRKTSMPRQRS